MNPEHEASLPEVIVDDVVYVPFKAPDVTINGVRYVPKVVPDNVVIKGAKYVRSPTATKQMLS